MTDLISRADAMGAVQDHFNANGFKGYDDGQKMMDRINALPSAEAVQETVPTVVRVTMSDGSQYYLEHERDAIQADAVHGEWVRKVKEYNDCDGHRVVYWYECDQCGARPPKDQWKNEWHSNYCPSCGARMKGGAE